MRLYINEDTANNSYVDAYIIHSIKPREIEPSVMEASIYIMEEHQDFFNDHLYNIQVHQLESYECFKDAGEVTSLEEAANLVKLHLLLE